MASVDYQALAKDILRETGGEGNLASFTHCATRLRLKLRDESKANTAAVEKLPGVLTVRQTGGQYQVVIGNEVPKAYEALTRIAGSKVAAPIEGGAGAVDAAPRRTGVKGLLDGFIELISAIILPVLWALSAAGLIKAFLSAATQFGWLDPDGTTNTILAAIGDSIFYFLPVFLAVTSAKRFRTDQFTSMAIAGALVYPSIVALAGADAGPVTFFGVPVVMMTYTSSLIPIIIAVWLQGYLERALEKALPAAIKNFTKPLLTMLIMVPLVLITIGPITTAAANAVSAGVTALFGFAPWLGGLILGGTWQLLVMFGLHWGIIPIMLNDLSAQGYSLLSGPVLPAVLAQGAATLAVFLRTRNTKRRGVAGPAALSGLLAGVTEPGIYGVNLPLKLPFYFGLAGGAIGGAIAAAGGNAANSFVFPSLLGVPAYMQIGNFTLQLIGSGLAMAIAFALTFLFGPRETADDAPAARPVAAPVEAAPVVTAPAGRATSTASAATTATTTQIRADVVELVAPVSGRVVPLAEVNDPVFSSGTLGQGVGIVPTDGVVRAPVSGTVLTAPRSGHAYGIRTPEGVEVLVHIGIDTVDLGGQHFEPRASQKTQIEAGDVLAVVDLPAVAAAGYDTTTIVSVTNTAKMAEVTPVAAGPVEAGDPIVTIRL